MITELIREDTKKVYFEYFSIDEKKFRMNRYLFGILFFSMLTVLALLYSDAYLWISVPIGFLVGYKLPYFNLILRKNNMDMIVGYMFPQYLQSFVALLSTSGNVYQTFVNTLEYTDEPLKKEVEKLIAKIEKDNDRKHYMDFADFIGTTDAMTIMDMIYSFSEYGVKKESLEKLQEFIQDIQENKIDELISYKVLKMEKYGLIPLFISLFFVGGFAIVIAGFYLMDVFNSFDGIF